MNRVRDHSSQAKQAAPGGSLGDVREGVIKSALSTEGSIFGGRAYCEAASSCGVTPTALQPSPYQGLWQQLLPGSSICKYIVLAGLLRAAPLTSVGVSSDCRCQAHASVVTSC